MTLVYVVTSGVYSDFDIEAVFADKQDAERHAVTLGDRYAGVQEHRLHQPGEQPGRRDVLNLRGTVANGELVHEDSWTNTVWEYEWDADQRAPQVNTRKATFAPPGRHLKLGEQRGKTVCVYGTDHDRVRAAYRDRIAQLRAEQQGL